MGYTSTYTGDLTVTPPLNQRERTYIRRLNRSAEGHIRRPGYHCPWELSGDGTTLTIPADLGTKEPVAEWTSYLATHLLGPGGDERFGRALSGFTYDHQIEGEVQVEGRSNGERWTLVAGGEGIWIQRQHLPCPGCWADMLMMVRPSNAYRFQHPVRAANLIDGTYPKFDYDAMEEECRSGTWEPAGQTSRQAVWPWSPDYYSAWWIDLDATPGAVPFTGDYIQEDGEPYPPAYDAPDDGNAAA